MQFLTSLFGGSGNEIVTTIVALAIVLLLIVLGLWGLKVLTRMTANMSRGRSRRLAVVETVAVDARRRLVIIRRDNVEHLVLTGGPHDVVVETGIPVERPTLPRRNDARPGDPRPGERRDAKAGDAPTRRSLIPTRRSDTGQDGKIAAKLDTKRAAATETSTAVAAPTPAAPPATIVSASTPAVPANGPAGPLTGMDRLKELSRPAGQRTSSSLRHTGLMRPVSRMEPAITPAQPENAEAPEPDSAKRQG
jgi:flagellar protein FliO/FliZ